MKVTLAWPADHIGYIESGDADETVDVADDVGTRLLRDGYARHPDGGVRGLSVREIEEAAAAEGVDLSAAKNKSDKAALLEAARAGEGN